MIHKHKWSLFDGELVSAEIIALCTDPDCDAFLSQQEIISRINAPMPACSECGKPVMADGRLVVADIDGITTITQAYCAEHWQKLGE